MDFFEVVIRNKRFESFDSEHMLTSDQIKQLLACAQLAPSLSDIQNFTYIIIDEKILKEKIAEFSPNFEWIKNASAIFAVVVLIREEDDTNIIDAIIASSQLMMATVINNLGYSLIVDFDQKAIGEILGLKDPTLEVIALIPVGKPLDKGTQGYKRTIAELSNHNYLGHPLKFP
ncbi:MAG: hypothetical protein EAX86_02775 [Candidatus Heimdallarchaeota archaeon]|nr:hypothetical protein [Candidatus Heimdallarchaeota archaeon]